MIEKHERVRKLTKGLRRRKHLPRPKIGLAKPELDDRARSSDEKSSPSLPSRETISEVLR
jgi:hypothetical protein